ncbi:hypothetical protein [Streptomyces sp. NPDC050704]|uniref:hypothetical protein n=1 Tax=Streptomyces sp. NPDC050704 TaxID=3157219 RepID=UPI00341A9780
MGTNSGQPELPALSQALQRTAKVAISTMVRHDKERLGSSARWTTRAIALHAMYWPDGVRSPAALAPQPVEISAQEMREAEARCTALWRRRVRPAVRPIGQKRHLNAR